MASALLASRNEPSWGENKVYMRKFTTTASKNPLLKPNPNPNPNSIPNPSPGAVRQPYDSSGGFHSRQIAHHPPSVAVPAAAAGASPNRKSMSLSEPRVSSQGYVTFKLGSFSRRELMELKRRLRSELEQVRALMSRIESRSVKRNPMAVQRNNPELEFGKSKKKKKKDVMSVVAVENKVVAGIKRTNPFGSIVPEAKRPAIDPVSEKLMASMLKRCAQILTKLMKHKFGWVFNAPVDVVGLKLHDYHQIVKNPMDLGTVKSNLEKDMYTSPLDFASDVRLTFNNALLYNPKGSDVNIMAGQLLMQFDQMFNPAYKKFENERRRVLGVGDRNAAPESAKRDIDVMVATKKPDFVPSKPTFSDPPPPVPHAHALTKPSAPAPAPVPVAKPTVNPRPLKLPKPKAKDPNKRQMSYEEKAKLGTSLQNLPPEKMGQLVQILKKRNGDLSQDGDEIELDIEAVDTETLWELDRFVSNYKKMVSKIKRQALMQAQNPAAQNIDGNKSLESDPPETAAVKSKKVDAAEEDVDIGEEIPMGNFPPVVIEKDATACASSGSSSSGSSSSGSDSSSSSDSDSGSSSGSDSDADSVQSPFVAASKEGSGS